MGILFLAFYLILPAAAQTLAIGSATSPAWRDMFAVAPGSLIVIDIDAPPEGWGNPYCAFSEYRFEMRPKGSTQVLHMTIVNSGRQTVLVPANALLGQADVIATGCGNMATGEMFLTRSSFGLFSLLATGWGSAIAQQITSEGTPATNQLTNPALPGQYVTTLTWQVASDDSRPVLLHFPLQTGGAAPVWVSYSFSTTIPVIIQ